jgi:hypothetical protein
VRCIESGRQVQVPWNHVRHAVPMTEAERALSSYHQDQAARKQAEKPQVKDR